MQAVFPLEFLAVLGLPEEPYSKEDYGLPRGRNCYVIHHPTP